LDKPSTTVRKEWGRWPQEAHLLVEDKNRYRRLSVAEIATIQGFEVAPLLRAGVDDRRTIEAIGNAVPPPLSKAVLETVDRHWTWENKTFLEICSGVGGLSSGAEGVGLEGLALVEYWDVACKILRERIEDRERVIEGDVLDFDFEAFKGQVGLLCGGPPCQPWSMGGQRKGQLDERDLMGRVPEIVAAVEPEVFVFENVPGLVLSKEHASYVENLVERLSRPSGATTYGVAVGVLNSADYGVPQTRKRVFFVGFRGRSDTFAQGVFQRLELAATHTNPKNPKPAPNGQSRKPWKSIGQAFDEVGLDDPGGWRIFLSSRESSRQLSVPQEQMANTIAIPSVSKSPTRLQLVWPGKGQLPRKTSDKWELEDRAAEIEAYPLIPQQGLTDAPPRYAAVQGDYVDALGALRPLYEGQVDLCYLDQPPVKSFDVRDSGVTNSVWLSLIREIGLGVRKLLRPQGMMCIHVDDESFHYARAVLEEVFGPNNYVCTFVWEKKYGPQNDSNLPTAAQDYLIVYANDVREMPILGVKADDDKLVDDGDPRGPWRAGHKGAMSGSELSKFHTNVPPYRWSLKAGELPPGLWRLSPMSGAIWGTPTQAGSWTFSIECTDKKGATAEQEFRIVVEGPGGDIPAEAEVECDWLFEDWKPEPGPLRIASGPRPAARVGVTYKSVVLANGGTPWKGRKKPGNQRYWEFSRQTLLQAVLEDDAAFGASGTAIPSIKKHQAPDAEVRTKRVLTWWPWETAGKSEDASKHLAELLDDGLIQAAPRIAKPEKLLKRLCKILVQREDALVASVADLTGSNTCTAIKLGHRVLHLAGKGKLEESVWKDCCGPRIQAVLDGRDNSGQGITKDEDVAWSGSASPLSVYSVGSAFLSHNLRLDSIDVNTTLYPPESQNFIYAVSTISGHFPIESSAPFCGRSINGDPCLVHLGSPLGLDDIARMREQFPDERIVFLAESVDEAVSDLTGEFVIRRIPFDLV
jgi:site-specific DNA-cytosine methylase